MTRNPSDKKPEPKGGRAAKRLEMFEEAREPAADSKKEVEPEPTKASKTRKKSPPKKGR